MASAFDDIAQRYPSPSGSSARNRNHLKSGGLKRKAKKARKIPQQSTSSIHDKLLRALEIKDTQWHDEEYDSDKDW